MRKRTNIDDDVAYTREASQNFLKRLPDPKDHTASPGVSPGASTMAAANASLIVVEDGAEDIKWGCWGRAMRVETWRFADGS